MANTIQNGAPPGLLDDLMDLDLVQLRRLKGWISDRIAEKERYSAHSPKEEVKEEGLKYVSLYQKERMS